MVALGLQQQGVHIRMTGNACRLCLNSLSTSDLESFRSGIAIQRHILSLEGCRLIAVLLEDPTEGCSYDTFADIAACTSEHDGMQTLNIEH